MKLDCQHHKIGWGDEALNEVGDWSRNMSTDIMRLVEKMKTLARWVADLET